MCKFILYALLIINATSLLPGSVRAEDQIDSQPSVKRYPSMIEKLWFERQHFYKNRDGVKVNQDINNIDYHGFEYLKKINYQKFQDGRENLFHISAQLYFEALERLEQEEIAAAIKLLQFAIQISPVMHEPYFLMVKIYLFQKGWDFENAWPMFQKGVKGYLQNLHGMIIDVGNIFLFLFLSLIICILVYIPFILLSYTRPLYHDLSHGFSFVKGYWRNIPIALVFALIIALPILVKGDGWEYLFILMVILSPYFKKRDLILSSIFALFLVISPYLFNITASYLQYARSVAQVIVQINMGNYDVERLANLDQKNTKEPFKDKRLLFAMGNFYLRTGNYLKAINYYERLIYLYPEYVKGYNNLGTSYFYIGKYENAKLAYLRAIELSNPPASAFFNLSRLYFTTQQSVRDQHRFLAKAKEIDLLRISAHMKKEIIGSNQYLIVESLSNMESYEIWKFLQPYLCKPKRKIELFLALSRTLLIVSLIRKTPLWVGSVWRRLFS